MLAPLRHARSGAPTLKGRGERMTSLVLDDATLRDLALWEEADGIVSLHVDASPARQAGNPPPAERAARAC